MESLDETSKTVSSVSLQLKVNHNKSAKTVSKNKIKQIQAHETEFVKNEISEEDSFTDFRVLNIGRKEIQTKLQFVKKCNSAKRELKCDTKTGNLGMEAVKTEGPYEFSGEGCSTNVGKKEETLKIVSYQEKNTIYTGEVNNQKGISCPLCWKRFDKDQINKSHLKTCAVKHKVSTQQLFDAIQLQEKQAAEREALGLPGVPCNSATRRVSCKKVSGKDDKSDPNLQLALALSASMRDAEEELMLQEDETLIEAGLGHEVLAKQTTLLERFGFTSLRPAMPTLSTKLRHGKSKFTGIPSLLTRTKEDRERLLTEKLAIILMGDEDTVAFKEQIKEQKDPIPLILKSQLLQECQNKESVLWTKASLSPSSMDKLLYYVECLSEFVSPSKIKAGCKLKHLSQVPCRLSTQAKRSHCTSDFEGGMSPRPFTEEVQSETSGNEDLTVNFQNNTASMGFSEHLAQEPNDKSHQVLENHGNLRSNHRTSHEEANVTGFLNKLMKDWKSLLNNKAMSDITIFVKNRYKIPAHELVFYVRCPKLLHDVKEVSGDSGKVYKVLMWMNVSFRSALAILEYIYCGSANRILSLSRMEEVLWIAKNYQILELDEHLRAIDKIRAKMSLQDSATRMNGMFTYKQGEGPPFSCAPESEEEICSQSLELPNYRTPNKKPNIDRNRSPLKKAAVSNTPMTIEKRNFNTVVDDQNYLYTSPDPFSESNTKNSSPLKVGSPVCSLQSSQENMECLLNLIKDSSPIQSQNMQESSQYSEKLGDKDIFSEADIDTSFKINYGRIQGGSYRSEQFVPNEGELKRNSELTLMSEGNKRKLQNSDSCLNQYVLNKRQCKNKGTNISKHLLDTFESVVSPTAHTSGNNLGVDCVTHTEESVIHENSLSPPDAQIKISGNVTDYQCNILNGNDTSVLNNLSPEVNTLDTSQSEDKIHVKDKERELHEKCKLNENVNEEKQFSINKSSTKVNSSGISCNDEDEMRAMEEQSDVSVGECELIDFHCSPCKAYIPDSPQSLCNTSQSTTNYSTQTKKASGSHIPVSERHGKSLQNLSSQQTTKQAEEEDSTDVIVLDDSTTNETILLPSPVLCKVAHPTEVASEHEYHRTPVRCSMDYVKCMLDDSLTDKIGQISTWTEDRDSLPGLSSNAMACSTPKHTQPLQGTAVLKTPVEKINSVGSNEVTPMLNYSAMSTPLLKKELQKYGLKPLKRKQAKQILTHIYNELHPWVPFNVDEKEGMSLTSNPAANFKKPDEDTLVPKSPAKRCLSNPSNPAGKDVSQSLESSDSEMESTESLSHESSSDSTWSDCLIVDDIGLDEQEKAQEDEESASSDLPIVVRNLLLNDQDLHQKVLLYEPIWLEELHAELKSKKYNFKLHQLIYFLDEQCITFRTRRQQNKQQRICSKNGSQSIKSKKQQGTEKKSKCKTESKGTRKS